MNTTFRKAAADLLNAVAILGRAPVVALLEKYGAKSLQQVEVARLGEFMEELFMLKPEPRVTGLSPLLIGDYGETRSAVGTAAHMLYEQMAARVFRNMEPGKPYRVTVIRDEITVEPINEGLSEAEHDAITEDIRESGGGTD